MAVQNVAGVNIDIAAMGGGIQIVAQIAAIGLLVLVFALVIRYILHFNKKVLLLIKTGEGGYQWKDDKGWQNNKKKEFKLMKHKTVICPYPQSDYLIMKNKKECYIGLVVNESLSWMKPDNVGNLVPQDINMMNFAVDMFARIDEATKLKQSFWDKYGHQILWGLSMMVFLIVIILILQKMDSIIGLANNVLSIPKEYIKTQVQTI